MAEQTLGMVNGLFGDSIVLEHREVATIHTPDTAVVPVEVVTTIVVPVYNEEAALPMVLRDLFKVIDATYEVLIIDDGSRDGSIAVASQFPCRIVQHTSNRGKGAALRTGIREAYGRNVIFIDADNTYPVEQIPVMVRLLDNHDLVRGIRRNGREHIPLLNRIGNQLFDGMIHMMHAVEGDDLLSGMYGGKRSRLLALRLQSAGFDIEAEINVKARAYGLTCATVPIAYLERIGQKKLKAFRDGLRILYRVLQLALTYNPLVVFILPGLLLFILGAIGASWMLFAPLRVADSRLSTNGVFALGVIGALGAQLFIFGLAIYAAGIAYGLEGRANRTLDWISHSLRKRLVILMGLLLGSLGGLGFLWLVVGWLQRAPGPFEDTVLLVLTSLCLLFSFQLLSSIAFLSALHGLRPRRREQVY